MYRYRDTSSIHVYESKQYLLLYNKLLKAEEYIETMTGINFKHMLDNDQFLEYMNVCHETAQSWRKQNLIKFILNGKKIFYTHEAIEEFIKNHRIPVTNKISHEKKNNKS